MQTMPKGTVMILHSDSKEWLQTAAYSGLLDPETRRKVEEVLTENAKLLKEIDRLKIWNRILEHNRRDNMNALLRGYAQRLNENEYRKDAFHVRLAIGALAVFLAISVTINLCVWMLM